MAHRFQLFTSDIVSITKLIRHYVQFLRLNASSANKVENNLGSYGFNRGRAHYCEKMMWRGLLWARIVAAAPPAEVTAYPTPASNSG